MKYRKLSKAELRDLSQELAAKAVVRMLKRVGPYLNVSPNPQVDKFRHHFLEKK